MEVYLDPDRGSLGDLRRRDPVARSEDGPTTGDGNKLLERLPDAAGRASGQEDETLCRDGKGDPGTYDQTGPRRPRTSRAQYENPEAIECLRGSA